MDGESMSFVPTRGSLIKKNTKNYFQAVTFQSYKSKKHEEDTKASVKSTIKIQNEFNIKQAKNEIVKFGMSGFDSQKTEEAKVLLAIKLGAKPPKKKYQNYKLLQAEKKIQKKKEMLRSHFQQLGKNSIGKSNAKGKSFDRKRRKEKGGILDIYGKIKAQTTHK